MHYGKMLFIFNICIKGDKYIECPFCCYLKDYIGQYIRIGVVCNCDTNNHIYRDGYITRSSFVDNTISLYSSLIGGNVIFATSCDNIFEIYLFNNTPGAASNTINKIEIKDMEEQMRNLLKSVQEGTFLKEG